MLAEQRHDLASYTLALIGRHVRLKPCEEMLIHVHLLSFRWIWGIEAWVSPRRQRAACRRCLEKCSWAPCGIARTPGASSRVSLATRSRVRSKRPEYQI